MSHSHIRRLCIQRLSGAWTRREIDLALEELVDEAITNYFGSDPVAMVSAHILRKRREEADRAHERAVGAQGEEKGRVISIHPVRVKP